MLLRPLVNRDEDRPIRGVRSASHALPAPMPVIDAYYVYLPSVPRALPYLALLVRGRAGFGSTASDIRATMRPRSTIVPNLRALQRYAGRGPGLRRLGVVPE